jgi:hypothetical protein
MTTYRHTQIGTTVIAVLGGAILFLLGRTLISGPGHGPLIALTVLLLCLLIFPSLTIEIREGFLRWRFGPGLIRKQVPLSEIVRTTPVRTTLLQGWGIHRTSGGWLYNVSGFKAVEFELRDGKRFRLGTDEPKTLVRAVFVHAGISSSPRS